MKRIGFGIVGLLLATAPEHARAAEWEIDHAHSSITFTIRHLGIAKVHGMFHEYAGELRFDENAFQDGHVRVTIQTASIDTQNEKRDGHLKTADFFDAATYPTIAFKSTSVEKAEGEGKYVLVGRLMIKDVKREVRIPFEFLGILRDERMGTRAGFEGLVTIRREDFGVAWDDLKWRPPALGNDVEIRLNLEVKQKV